jgi:hypothetical protein
MGIVDGASESALRHSAFHESDAITTNALTVSSNTRVIFPDRMGLDEAKSLIALPQGYDSVLKINRRLYYGDHWLDGFGWKGPWPMPPEGATIEETALVVEMQTEIVRGFTSRNAFAECVERHTTGCVGTEPKWTWTPDGVRVRSPRSLRRPGGMPPAPVRETPRDPAANPPGTPPRTPPGTRPSTGSEVDPTTGLTPEEAAAAALRDEQRTRIELLNAQLTRWWDDQNAAQVFQSFVRSLLYARIATLRLYIPSDAFEREMAAPANAGGARHRPADSCCASATSTTR